MDTIATLQNKIVRNMKLLLRSAILLLLLPAFSFAESPFFVTETAIPIGTESYRLEGGLRFDKASTHITSLSASFRYGLVNNLEIAATLPYLFADNGVNARNELGDVFLAAKVRFLKGREANPLSFAGAIKVKIPLGTQPDLVEKTGKADVGFSVLASKEIPPYEAHLNLGYTFMGNPSGQNIADQINYSLGLEYKEFRPNLSLMGELFGTANDSGLADTRRSIALGAKTFARSDIIIDAALGIGLSNHAPDYILNTRISYFFN